jgi:transposase
VKKISTVQAFGNEIFKEQKLTIGLDLGDRWWFYCILDEAGKIILEQKVPTTPEAMKQTFSRIPQSRIALETGTHSPWVSRLLTELGHEVIVAHAQKVQLITKSNRKMIDTMREHWHDWRESIPSCWDRCGIAVPKRKFI